MIRIIHLETLIRLIFFLYHTHKCYYIPNFHSNLDGNHLVYIHSMAGIIPE